MLGPVKVCLEEIHWHLEKNLMATKVDGDQNMSHVLLSWALIRTSSLLMEPI